VDPNKAREYIIGLPLLVSVRPELRLGGLVFRRTDANFKPASDVCIYWCRLPERVLPSPSYLFAQRIDPHSLMLAQSEAEFLRKCRVQFPERTLITWSPEPLAAFSAAAARCFQRDDVLSKLDGLTSLRTALWNEHFLGGGDKAPVPALERCAMLYGFKAQEKLSLKTRVEMLVYLCRTLRERNERLFDYMAGPESGRRALLQECFSKGSLAACVTADGKYGLARPFLVQDGIFSLALYAGGEITWLRHDVRDLTMIAPRGVFTPERVQKLGYDISAAEAALAAVRPPEAAPQQQSPLSSADRAFISRCRSRNSVAEIDPNCSQALKGRYFIYLGDCERDRLNQAQLKRYQDLTLRDLRYCASAYAEETARLVNRVREDSEEDGNLIALIRQYPADL